MERIYEAERIQQAGRSYFAVNWTGNGGCRKEALAAGGCTFYLPTRFLQRGSQLTAYYDDTNFVPLNQRYARVLAKGDSILRLTVGVFRKLTEGEREGEDFLLGGDSILYRSDCVFLSGETGRAAMAYIPVEERRMFSERILSLAGELCGTYPGQGLELLVEKLEQELSRGAGGTTGLLRLFSRWEREL